MRPHSILVHGDTPGAVALARAIRREIEAAGGRVVPVSRLMVCSRAGRDRASAIIIRRPLIPSKTIRLGAGAARIS